MTFAGTAAFVLPEPFGPLASGALSVVNMFFGEPAGPDYAVRQALNETLQQFQTQQFASTIKSAAVSLKSAAWWLDTNIRALQDVNDMDRASAFVKDVLAKISEVDSPDAALPKALDTLNDPQYLDDPIVGSSAYTALAFGVGLYLTYLRLRIQMQSWQSANSENADLNYGWFDVYRQNTNVWGGVIANQIDEYQTSRLMLVGPVQRNNGFFNFKDAGERPPGAGTAPVPGWSGSNFGPITSDNQSALESQSEADRTAYMGQVQSALAVQYPDGAAIGKWMDSLASSALYP